MDVTGDDEEAVRLTPHQISQLAALLRQGGSHTVQLETARGRFDITLSNIDADAPAEGVGATPASGGETVRAPAVGEFLTSHPGRVGLLTQQGARLAPGELLALVRTGMVLAPVLLPAEDARPATLTRVLVQAGTLVGYGTPLFEIERH